jgi:hypothetical protein
VRRIALNLHAAATAITLLTPPQFPVNERQLDLQARRQARQNRNQSLAVRLPGSEIAQHEGSILPDGAASWPAPRRIPSDLNEWLNEWLPPELQYPRAVESTGTFDKFISGTDLAFFVPNNANFRANSGPRFIIRRPDCHAVTPLIMGNE